MALPSLLESPVEGGDVQISSNNDDTNRRMDDFTPPPPFYRETMSLEEAVANNISGELEIDRHGQLMMNYFEARGVIGDLLGAYNLFVEQQLALILASRPIRKEVKNADGQLVNISYIFTNSKIEKPFYVDNGNPVPLYPRQARQERRTYAANLYADIIQVDQFGQPMSNENGPIQLTGVKICEIPVMLGSVLDNLHGVRGHDLLKVGECMYDPFGYFIIKGSEKIIMTQNQLRSNRILIYPDRDGDLLGLYTPQSIKGQMPVKMYTDNDGSIRFYYSVLSSKVNGGIAGKTLVIKAKQKNKEASTANILQIFRILGNNDNILATNQDGTPQLDEHGQPIYQGRFSDVTQAIKFILSFIRPEWRRHATIFMQSSYKEVLGIGDDYDDIYEKSIFKTRWLKDKARESASADKKNTREFETGYTRVEKVKRVNDSTVERIFSNIGVDHLTVQYIQAQTIQYIESDQLYQLMVRNASAAEIAQENNRRLTGIQQIVRYHIVEWRRHFNQDSLAVNAENIKNALISAAHPELMDVLRQIEIRAVVRKKINLLAIMTARFIEISIGKRDADDRDSINNQRFIVGGKVMEQLFRQMWDDSIIYLVKNIGDTKRPDISWLQSNMGRRSSIMSSGFVDAFSPNNWGPPSSKRASAKKSNITDRLDRGHAQVSIYSHLLRINAPTNRKVKSSTVRSIKPSQIGYICPIATPSGERIGLVTNKATTCWISIERLPNNVWNALNGYDVVQDYSSQTAHTNSFIINGIPHGWCNGELLRRKLVKARRSGKIDFDTTIVFSENVLYVYTDAGRPTKPVLILENNVPLIATKNLWGAPFDVLMKEGVVEYLDQWEFRVHYYLAHSITQLKINKADLDRNNSLFVQLQFRLEKYIEDLKVVVNPEAQATPRLPVENQSNFESIIGLIQSGKAGQNYEKWLKTHCDFDALFQQYQRTQITIRRLEVKKYTHLDMDPSSIFGIMASIIPLPERIAGPRNVYQCQMQQQAMGINHSNPQHQFPATGRALAFPHQPILATQMQRILRLDHLPAGATVVLAIMTVDNNEEDAIIVKKEALERGLFMYVLTHSSHIELRSDHVSRNTSLKERLVKPIKPMPGHTVDNYTKIDERGLAIPNLVVNPGDCLVGAIQIIQDISNGQMIGQPKILDHSVYVKKGEGGVVDRVLVAQTVDGNLSISIRVRKTGKPIDGDKFATRQAQKSVAGIVRAERDMPYVAGSGITPDIIINAHAIPKRMTITTLIEMVTSKYAAMAGERINASAFKEFDVDTFTELLETLYGYNPSGTETMINPATGETYPSQIMVGPAYYQLLKHQVDKKIQFRGKGGPRAAITGQAVKGKKRGGGVNFGRAMVSGALAHGAANFARERLYDVADKFNSVLCQNCNKVTTVDILEEQSTCANCQSGNIGSCQVPRVWTAFNSYVAGLNVKMEPYHREKGEKKLPTRIAERPIITKGTPMVPANYVPPAAAGKLVSTAAGELVQAIDTARSDSNLPFTRVENAEDADISEEEESQYNDQLFQLDLNSDEEYEEMEPDDYDDYLDEERSYGSDDELELEM